MRYLLAFAALADLAVSSQHGNVHHQQSRGLHRHERRRRFGLHLDQDRAAGNGHGSGGGQWGQWNPPGQPGAPPQSSPQSAPQAYSTESATQPTTQINAQPLSGSTSQAVSQPVAQSLPPASATSSAYGSAGGVSASGEASVGGATGVCSVRTSSSCTSAPGSTYSSFAPACTGVGQQVQGVNLGGWLVLEQWITPNLFKSNGISNTDQWSFDSTSSTASALESHWASFITEADIKALPNFINTVRIPIGYWAFVNDGTPYHRGADVWLWKAVKWCQQAGKQVIIDLHGAAGSQNGDCTSGHSTDDNPSSYATSWDESQWLQPSNTQLTLNALMAISEYVDANYGNDETVLAIELTNEPKVDANNMDEFMGWTTNAFNAIATQYPCGPKIMIHDAWLNPSTWAQGTFFNSLGGNQARFVLDVHMYENQNDKATQGPASAFSSICGYGQSEFLPQQPRPALAVIVGEFSPQVNMCGVQSDTQTGNLAASNDGSHTICTNDRDMSDYTPAEISMTTKILSGQLQQFDSGSQGWVLWTLKMESEASPWSFQALLEYNVWPSSAASVC